jgi:CDP-diacylglycerol--serine O-phosphatidyltransferase
MLQKRVQLLPNLITLANAFCGLLALSKTIDALTLSREAALVFYEKMEAACFLVFLGMVFDALDGLVARMTGGGSAFGAQLDSFSDALTFGAVPALMTKVLIEHETPPTPGNARLHFLAAATFALMAILRLVRFNLEPDPSAAVKEREEEFKTFRGLPSPAAAGTVASTLWLYLILRRPELEIEEGTPTWLHRLVGVMRDVEWAPLLDWIPSLLLGLLPILGLLMVSNLRYVHGISYVLSRRAQFVTLVAVVFSLILFYLAPVPILFLAFVSFTASGLLLVPLGWLRSWKGARGPA